MKYYCVDKGHPYSKTTVARCRGSRAKSCNLVCSTWPSLLQPAGAILAPCLWNRVCCTLKTTLLAHSGLEGVSKVRRELHWPVSKSDNRAQGHRQPQAPQWPIPINEAGQRKPSTKHRLWQLGSALFRKDYMSETRGQVRLKGPS